MKRFILILVFVLMAVAASAQHSHGLNVISYGVKSAHPASLRSIKGRAELIVNNNGKERIFSNIHAQVYRRGVPFVEGECSDVDFVEGKRTYILSGLVSLSQGQNLWKAIGAALSFRARDYTIDVTMDVAYPSDPSMNTTLVRKGIPLSRYLD